MEQNNTSTGVRNSEIEIETKKPKIFFALGSFLSIFLIFILVAVVSSGIVFYAYTALNQIDFQKEKRISPEQKKLPSPTPSPTPTLTTTPTQ